MSRAAHRRSALGRRAPARAVAVAALAVVSATLWPLLAASAAAAETAGIRSVDTAHYPTVSVDLVLPSALPGDVPVTAEVVENGVAISGTKVEADPQRREPVDVVLVLDTSGSMRGEPLRAARDSARAFLGGLRASDRVALVSFGDTPSVRVGFTTDREEVLASASGLQARGETALYDALQTAAQVAQGGTRGRTSIVLLSDGGDTVSGSSLDGAFAALRAAGAPVFAVALRSPEYDGKALALLADRTGGRFVAVSEAARLPESFGGIARDLRAQARVTFTSREPQTKDLDLDVTLAAGATRYAAFVSVTNPRFAAEDASSSTVVAPQPTGFALGAAVMGVLLSASLATYGIGTALARRRSSLAQVAYYDQGGASGAGVDPDSLATRVSEAVDQIATKRGYSRLIQERLERGGIMMRSGEFITLHVIGVVVAGALAAVVGGWLPVAPVVIVATVVPLALLDGAAQRRKKRFEEQLPDALNLVAGSLRAGYGLLQSIALVVEETLPPISAEFGRLQTQARLGLPLETALDQMARRIDSPDFTSTVTAITIQREVGGNLAEVLDIVAATIREREALRRQVASLTADGRLSAVILFILPFVEAGGLMVINPRYFFSMFGAPIGIAMGLGAVGLMIVGALWMRSIVSIEV